MKPWIWHEATGNIWILPGTVVRHLGRGIVKKKRERWCTGWLVSRGRGSKRKERRARRKVRMAGPTSAECNNLEHLPSDSRVLSHPGEQGGRIRRSVSSYSKSDLALFHTHTIRVGSLFCTFTGTCAHVEM